MKDLCQHSGAQHTSTYFKSKATQVILCSLHKELFEKKFGESELDDWEEYNADTN